MEDDGNQEPTSQRDEKHEGRREGRDRKEVGRGVEKQDKMKVFCVRLGKEKSTREEERRMGTACCCS